MKIIIHYNAIGSWKVLEYPVISLPRIYVQYFLKINLTRPSVTAIIFVFQSCFPFQIILERCQALGRLF